MKYTKDQLEAMITILNARNKWMTCARHLRYDNRCLILNDTTLILLNEPVYHNGDEFDAERLISSNETTDVETCFAVDPAVTHCYGKYRYVKLGDNTYFDPIVLKRAFRALKYRGETVTLHYAVDRKTLQRYCCCLTFMTDYGYALVMACRIKDVSALQEVNR